MRQDYFATYYFPFYQLSYRKSITFMPWHKIFSGKRKLIQRGAAGRLQNHHKSSGGKQNHSDKGFHVEFFVQKDEGKNNCKNGAHLVYRNNL